MCYGVCVCVDVCGCVWVSGWVSVWVLMCVGCECVCVLKWNVLNHHKRKPKQTFNQLKNFVQSSLFFRLKKIAENEIQDNLTRSYEQRDLRI